MAAWRVTRPKAGTSEPLAVTFPEALDHGLLRRALGVAKAGAPGLVGGDAVIESGETRWLFTPRDAWVAGNYQLVAFAFLEDLAGNRVGRALKSTTSSAPTSRPNPNVAPFRSRSNADDDRSYFEPFVSSSARSAHPVVEIRCA